MPKRKVTSARQAAASRANGKCHIRQLYRGLAVSPANMPASLNGLSILSTLKHYSPEFDIAHIGPGLGVHWTTDSSVAQAATHSGRGNIGIVLKGTYRGHGRTFTHGVRANEREVEIPNSHSPRVSAMTIMRGGESVTLSLSPVGKAGRKQKPKPRVVTNGAVRVSVRRGRSG